MHKKKLFLHLGYPKTGSTTLNEIIMPNIKGVKCFAPNTNYKFLRQNFDDEYLKYNYKIKVLLENFLYRDKEDKDIQEGLKTLKLIKEKRIFISTTGAMSSFFFKGLYAEKNCFLDSRFISEKIKDVFGEFFDVSIIIIIRKQWTWIPSAYAEWHRFLDEKTFKQFTSKFINENEQYHKGIDYYQTISGFEKNFSKENIFISTQEKLTTNSFDFYSSIIEFLGGEIEEKLIRNTKKRNNRSLHEGSKSVDSLNLLLFLYPFKLKYIPNMRFNIIKKYPWLLDIMSYIKMPYKDISKTINLSNGDISRLKKIYMKSNKKLSEKYNLNLQKMEYFDI